MTRTRRLILAVLPWIITAAIFTPTVWWLWDAARWVLPLTPRIRTGRSPMNWLTFKYNHNHNLRDSEDEHFMRWALLDLHFRTTELERKLVEESLLKIATGLNDMCTELNRRITAMESRVPPTTKDDVEAVTDPEELARIMATPAFREAVADAIRRLRKPP